MLLLTSHDEMLAYDESTLHVYTAQHNHADAILPLIHPSHALRHQELIQSFRGIESTPSTVLDTAMWKNWFIMDGHTVDVHGAIHSQLNTFYVLNESNSLEKTHPD